MIIPTLPTEAAPRLQALAPAFTQPTWHRFTLLLNPDRGHPDHRPPHRGQPPPHRRPAGGAPPDQLPARPLRRLLVRPAPRLSAHWLYPASPRPRRPRPPGRRRYRREPPRPQGLRQGPAPGPSSLQPLVYGLVLRPQVGRARGAGPLPLRYPPLGAA